jgi:hypothetical protein
MFELDLSEVRAMHDRELTHLREAPRALAGFCREAAAEERRTHAYRNRTGRLQASTAAVPFGAGIDAEFGCTVEASTPYAGFVNNRGLMRIDQLAERAGDRFLEWLELPF